jgi:hypothetical protein
MTQLSVLSVLKDLLFGSSAMTDKDAKCARFSSFVSDRPPRNGPIGMLV